jgi:hypothetical protein
VIIQWRVINCAVSVPSFEMVIVYRKNHWLCAGCDRSAAYSDSTWTLMPRVTASDVNIPIHDAISDQPAGPSRPAPSTAIGPA